MNVKIVAVGMLCATSVGCVVARPVASFRPMVEAMGVVRANRELVDGGLKAVGTARGSFVDDSDRRRRFDLSATLQVVSPGHMRFVLRSVLGGDEVEVGMNDSKWWLLMSRPEEKYFEGRLDSSRASLSGTLPLHPTQLVESLGFGPLEWDESVQRVTEEFQQLVVVDEIDSGSMAICREYWLDRYAPWLLRRVVYRDGDGRVSFRSELDGYDGCGVSGSQLPHLIRLSWPGDDAWMEFRVRRWKEIETLDAGHRAFVSPHDRGRRFDYESFQD